MYKFFKKSLNGGGLAMPKTNGIQLNIITLPDSQLILDQLSTAICIITLEHSIAYINSAAENILQISSQRAIHQPVSHIARLPKGLLERLAQAGANQQPFAQRESTWIIHEQDITMDLVVTPVAHQQKTSHLILELQVVDRILKISRVEKTHHSHQAHRALIRGLAHEVKNPLGAIRGAAQLMARGINIEFHEYTNLIIHEVDRLSKLVDSMLGPRTPLSLQEYNIHEIIEHVIQLGTVEAKNKDFQNTIYIKRHYDLSLPKITADKDRLIQALLNIMTNARQALMSLAQLNHTTSNHTTSNHNNKNTNDTNPLAITITTQIERQITLHHRLHRLAIRIIIEDNGPGIPEHLMLSLFYPLVSGRADGSGIGLSIAQHIIQQHGGILECKSTVGATQFHFIIPAHCLPLESNTGEFS